MHTYIASPLWLRTSEDLYRRRLITSSPSNSGLIRCLAPMGGPADVYTLYKHASIIQATPMMSSCLMAEAWYYLEVLERDSHTCHATPAMQGQQSRRSERFGFYSDELSLLACRPYPEEKELYKKRSPINSLDTWKTPTAFFQVV